MRIQDLATGTRFMYCGQLFIKIQDNNAMPGYTAAYNTQYPPVITYIKTQ